MQSKLTNVERSHGTPLMTSGSSNAIMEQLLFGGAVEATMVCLLLDCPNVPRPTARGGSRNYR
eukprot:3209579-Amphidinium_carterae.4